MSHSHGYKGSREKNQKQDHREPGQEGIREADSGSGGECSFDRYQKVIPELDRVMASRAGDPRGGSPEQVLSDSPSTGHNLCASGFGRFLLFLHDVS